MRLAVLAFTLTPASVSMAQAPCPRGILPAYSHNDYLNVRPLRDALGLGFRGAEADVFLVHGVLRVGHDRRAAERGGTLEQLYLAPLQEISARCGSFTSSGAPFLFTVDLKEPSLKAHEELLRLLARYSDLFSPDQRDGKAHHRVLAVQVGPRLQAAAEASGAASALLGQQYQIARVDDAVSVRDSESIRLVSLDYGKTVGRWWVTSRQRRRWLATLSKARQAAPGVLLRVHNVPAQRRVYDELFRAGVDLIGTKDLKTTHRLLTTR
jgi:hypothetical protein